MKKTLVFGSVILGLLALGSAMAAETCNDILLHNLSNGTVAFSTFDGADPGMGPHEISAHTVGYLGDWASGCFFGKCGVNIQDQKNNLTQIAGVYLGSDIYYGSPNGYTVVPNPACENK